MDPGGTTAGDRPTSGVLKMKQIPRNNVPQILVSIPLLGHKTVPDIQTRPAVIRRGMTGHALKSENVPMGYEDANSAHTPGRQDLQKPKTPNINNLKLHTTLNKGVKLFACKLCNYRTWKKLSLKAHKMTHLANKPFVSRREGPEAKNNVSRHLETHSEGKLFQCVTCDYHTNQEANFVEHKRTHVSEAKLRCDDCDYQANSPAFLCAHKKVHSEEKPYKCGSCSYSSKWKSNLKQHMDSRHSENKQFKCDLCNYQTRWKVNLENHMDNVHWEEKPFICDFCDYQTRWEGSLKNHMDTLHGNEKRFKCNLCDYRTRWKGNLKKHILGTHRVKKPSKLDSDDYQARQKLDLKDPKRSNTGKELVHDEQDDKTIPSSASSERPKLNYGSKLLMCDRCNYKTNNRRHLKVHKKTHLAKNLFTCEVCSYRTLWEMNLKKHIMHVHAREKKFFTCNICDYQSRLLSALKLHKKTHVEENTLDYRHQSNNKTIYPNLEKHTSTLTKSNSEDIKHALASEESLSCSDPSNQQTDTPTIETTRIATHSELKPDYEHAHQNSFMSSKQAKPDSIESASDKLMGSHTRDERIKMRNSSKRHTVIKPFACDECSYRTKWKHNLTVHMRIHSGDKPFECDKCDYRSAQSSSLNKHKETHRREKHLKFIRDRRNHGQRKTTQTMGPEKPHLDQLIHPCNDERNGLIEPTLEITSQSSKPCIEPTDILTGTSNMRCSVCFKSTSKLFEFSCHGCRQFWNYWKNASMPPDCPGHSTEGEDRDCFGCRWGRYNIASKAWEGPRKIENELPMGVDLETFVESTPDRTNIQNICEKKIEHTVESMELDLYQSVPSVFEEMDGLIEIEESRQDYVSQPYQAHKNIDHPVHNSYLIQPQEIKFERIEHEAELELAHEDMDYPVGNSTHDLVEGTMKPQCHTGIKLEFFENKGVLDGSFTQENNPDQVCNDTVSQTHQEPSTEQEMLKCDDGDLQTSPNSLLHSQKRVKTGKKPLQCDQCEYSCSGNSNLIRHMTKHTETKEFACDRCAYRTKWKNNLKQHLKRHTGEKPYTCDKCGFQSAYRRVLSRHIMTIHRGSKVKVILRFGNLRVQRRIIPFKPHSEALHEEPADDSIIPPSEVDQEDSNSSVKIPNNQPCPVCLMSESKIHKFCCEDCRLFWSYWNNDSPQPPDCPGHTIKGEEIDCSGCRWGRYNMAAKAWESKGKVENEDLVEGQEHDGPVGIERPHTAELENESNKGIEPRLVPQIQPVLEQMDKSLMQVDDRTNECTGKAHENSDDARRTSELQLPSEITEPTLNQLNPQFIEGMDGFLQLAEDEMNRLPERAHGNSDQADVSCNYGLIDNLTQPNHLTEIESGNIDHEGSWERSFIRESPPNERNNLTFSNIEQNPLNRPINWLVAEPFRCDNCDFQTWHGDQLDSHRSSHHAEKTFLCELCNFSTNRESHLIVHKITHREKILFSCDLCSYHTKWKHNLKQHMRTHSGEKPFKCDKCDHRTSLRSSLRIHKERRCCGNKLKRIKKKITHTVPVVPAAVGCTNQPTGAAHEEPTRISDLLCPICWKLAKVFKFRCASCWQFWNYWHYAPQPPECPGHAAKREEIDCPGCRWVRYEKAAQEWEAKEKGEDLSSFSQGSYENDGRESESTSSVEAIQPIHFEMVQSLDSATDSSDKAMENTRTTEQGRDLMARLEVGSFSEVSAGAGSQKEAHHGLPTSFWKPYS